MQVKFTSHAKECLYLIYDYYKSVGQVKIGRGIRSKIINKALSLSNFPNLGQIEKNLEHLELNHRYLVVGNHKLISTSWKLVYIKKLGNYGTTV